MKYDVLIRIDKLNTDLSEDEIRDILSVIDHKLKSF